MLTLNGVPTEKYQDLVVRGDFEVDGETTFVNDNTVTHEGAVVVYENEVVTFE